MHGATLTEKRPHRAVAAYKKAMELAPDRVPAVMLAKLLATCPVPGVRDLEEAVRLASEAVRHAPLKAWYWSTLGLVQYRAGDLPAAMQALGKAIELGDGGSARDWLYLAMARWRTGEKRQAGVLLSRAVAWMEEKDPDDQDLSRLRTEAEALVR